MTTLVTPAATATSRPARPVAPQRFSRLIRVELRKMLDTRSGIAVPAVTLLAVAGVLTYLVIRGNEPSFGHLGQPMTLFLTVFPVIPLLGVTSEWTTRTALPTYTLTPRRGRVLGAKVLASMTIVSTMFVLSVGLIAAATVVAGAVSGNGADFAGTGGQIRSMAVMLAVQTAMALGFGSLVQNTPVALVAYFLAPTVVSVLANEVLPTSIGQWIDVFGAADRLGAANFADLGPTVVALLLWVAAPLTVGVLRTLRREVK
jgi:hypothetical protein